MTASEAPESAPASVMPDRPRVRVERRGPMLLMGLDRPDKRNAADHRMLAELALAYGELDRDPELRVGVVHGIGDHFTGGLDLGDVAPRIGDDGLDVVPEGGVNPWRVDGTGVSKPVIVAVQGSCLTLGIELILAADIAVAADSASFAQLEVSRGILPFGGATLRLPAAIGWGNAMRWMLTGDAFDAAEALRLGLVQEVVPHGTELERAIAIAERIAAQAPLAVQATLANARLAQSGGEEAAALALQPELVRLSRSEDAGEGVRAFLERREPGYRGR